MPSLDVLMENETSIVYVKDSATGEFVEQQRMEGTNSIWKDLEEMPLHMQHAIMAIEDERFYDHYGVDWKRTISAMANLVLHFSDVEYGGSTITQQLVRLVTDEKEHSIQRKSPRFSAQLNWNRNITPRNRFWRPTSTLCR